MLLIVNIPDGAKCLLKSGQEVDFNTPFIENVVTKEITLHVAKKLNIASDKIFNYLTKFVGDAVEKNEVIAEKKGLIGTAKVTSQSKGIIKEVNHNTGEIILSAFTSQTGSRLAFFKGHVSEIDGKQLKIKVTELHEFPVKFASSDFGGETFYLRKQSESIIATNLTDKIMISESISPYLIAKSEALGVNGFVSLKNPPVETTITKAQLKNIDDFKKILHLDLPYCLINKQYSKIYFYK